MPNLDEIDNKLTLGKLRGLSDTDRSKMFEPIVKEHREQINKIANSIIEASKVTQNFSSVVESFKFPIAEMVEKIKLVDDLPKYHLPTDISAFSFTKYDPPVTIKKSKWEIKKEEREAYRTELQIQILEQQLNLYNGMLMPQYDINLGLIKFMGKNIEIPLNTNMEMVCRVVLKNIANMKRKWSWDEIVEANRESSDKYTSRQIYTAARSVNEKVAIETQLKDFFIVKPQTTVQFNPLYMEK